MNETQIIDQSETLKLMKMSKGYNWEIKIFPKSLNDEDWINRIEKINNRLIEKFNIIE